MQGFNNEGSMPPFNPGRGGMGVRDSCLTAEKAANVERRVDLARLEAEWEVLVALEICSCSFTIDNAGEFTIWFPPAGSC